MRRKLYQELGKMMLMSCGLFGAFFLLLWLAELLIPSLSGVLLHWDDPAFLVGIPASVIGVAYVLTIRNPKNYTGFILGIAMSLLLAWQFYLQGNYDLVFLYVLVFVPFMIMSFRAWRANTLGQTQDQGELRPTFVQIPKFMALLVTFIVVIAADYVLNTLLIYRDAWSEHAVLKILGGAMIASSLLANILMIRQRNDAWINWVIYSAVGMIFYIVVDNMFSILLFLVFLIINARAQYAWLKMTQHEDFGWTRRVDN